MSILDRAPLSLPKELIAALQQLYANPPRFYHNFGHIESLLEHYHQLSAHWIHPLEVYLAFLYHDAIYEYGAKDNEEQSARVAQQEIQKHLSDINIDIDLVMRLIRHTANHGSLKAEELNEEEKLFLDCDMSIIGSSLEKFYTYEEQIEQEYTQLYPRALYLMGRKKFRNKLLSADRIFFSDHFHSQLDAQARANLRAANRKQKLFNIF